MMMPSLHRQPYRAARVALAAVRRVRAAGDYEDQPFHGNEWTTGHSGDYLSSPSDALRDIENGNPATVAPEDVRLVLDKAADAAGPIDFAILLRVGYRSRSGRRRSRRKRSGTCVAPARMLEKIGSGNLA